MKMAVSHVDIKIDGSTENSLRNGALKVLEIIRPNWENIKFKVYTDGITNKLIGAWNEGKKDEQILIRVYGENTELFIDRSSEAENMKILHLSDMGPELFTTFENGIAYGFVEGTPLTTEYIYKEKIWKSIAEEMAKFHKIKVESKEPSLFKKMNTFYSLLPDDFTLAQNKRLGEAGLDKATVLNEIEFLKKHLDCSSCSVVFSHNDILLANIIWNESRGDVKFIDYEYGAPNFQPFDIGNHFNEFAGVDTVDYDLYPNEEFQKKWLRHYLKHYSDSDQVDEQQVTQLAVLVNQYSLASHVFWGTWALLQACNSSIDFDFLGYGIIRMKEYLRRKSIVFNL